MTVTNLQRRSFFQKFRDQRPVLEKETPFGTVKMLMPSHNRELPLVPAPTVTVTFNSGLEPYTGAWGFEQAAHLLRRTGFGFRKSEIDLLLGMNLNQAVSKLLEVPAAPPDPPVNNYYHPQEEEGYNDPNIPLGETWVNAAYDNGAEGYRTESWRGWWLNLMINQEASILEKLTLFWHNHFSTQAEAVFFGKFVYKHNVTLRTHALGNFKELTKQVTIDPLMLYYLNGYLNSKDAPDENYARELQELFTIGKDNPDHYTEEDVVAAARVLTGWRYADFEAAETFFYVPEHDLGDKQFSSFYNNTVIQGSLDGEAELDALLDMIFAKNEVSEYLCRKLYRWFVYYHISDATEQNVIQPMAQIFRENNYEVLPVLEALLKSAHFYEAANKGCFIKTPLDAVIGTLRNFNLSVPASTPYNEFVMHYILNYYFLNVQQMLPGDPPNVAGWQAFRQVPIFYRMWLNGDTLKSRREYSFALCFYYLEAYEDQLKIDHIAYVSQFTDPSDPNLLVDDLVKMLLPQPVSAQKKIVMKSKLLTALPNDSYWTIAWFDYLNSPGDEMAYNVVNLRLSSLVFFILSLPEYELA